MKTIRFVQNAQRHGVAYRIGQTVTWDDDSANAYVAVGQAVAVSEAATKNSEPSPETAESKPPKQESRRAK